MGGKNEMTKISVLNVILSKLDKLIQNINLDVKAHGRFTGLSRESACLETLLTLLDESYLEKIKAPFCKNSSSCRKNVRWTGWRTYWLLQLSVSQQITRQCPIASAGHSSFPASNAWKQTMAPVKHRGLFFS